MPWMEGGLVPVRPIVARIPEIGRLRLGEAKVDPKRPGKPLDHFRFTSSSRANVEAVAAVYGGTPVERGGQWEVIVESESLDVLIPPQNAYSFSYELWSGGALIRRCDGVTASTVEKAGEGWEEMSQPCLCDEEKPDCKPTLRLNLILRGVEVFGVALMQSTGWNAASEIPAMIDAAQVAAHGGAIPATLRIESRTSKSKTKGTRNFKVPKLEIRASVERLMQGIGVEPLRLADNRMLDVGTGEIASPDALYDYAGKPPAMMAGQSSAVSTTTLLTGELAPNDVSDGYVVTVTLDAILDQIRNAKTTREAARIQLEASRLDAFKPPSDAWDAICKAVEGRPLK